MLKEKRTKGGEVMAEEHNQTVKTQPSTKTAQDKPLVGTSGQNNLNSNSNGNQNQTNTSQNTATSSASESSQSSSESRSSSSRESSSSESHHHDDESVVEEYSVIPHRSHSASKAHKIKKSKIITTVESKNGNSSDIEYKQGHHGFGMALLIVILIMVIGYFIWRKFFPKSYARAPKLNLNYFKKSAGKHGRH